NDPRSNYALAKKTLFTPLNIMPSQVYRMAGESSDPQAAAFEYEQQLRLATKTVSSAQSSLDLVLLGLGEDGHTASLFPGASILRDHQRVIAATQSPKDPPNRLTMTLAAINRASVILFLVIGAGKAGVVRAILDPRTEAEQQLPASLVSPEEGRLIWFLDQAAAAELPKR
ncbi:MAG TPA: 6-phosphogluconolactonase, partial [Nitrospiraceae bacterium]|nr:6-phosphogluconolactonase [Nitrospiraceae bacterium]